MKKTLLPDGVELIKGLPLSTKERAQEAKGRDKRRELMYNLLAEHSETADELLDRVHKSRMKEPKPEYRIINQEALEHKGQRIMIKDLTPRALRLFRRGQLDWQLLVSASQFIYFKKIGSFLFSVPTNFPKHEKVQGGQIYKHPYREVRLNIPKKIDEVLTFLLIEDGAFSNTPGVEAKGRTIRHNQGISIFKRSLRDFRILLANINA